MTQDWRLTRSQIAIWTFILVVVFVLAVLVALSGIRLLQADGTTDHRIGLLLLPIGIVFASFALMMSGMIIRQQRRTRRPGG